MQTEKTKAVLASVVILGTVTYLYFSMTPRPPDVDAKLHQAVGQIAAEETARLLGNGGRVAIFSRDTAAFSNPAMDYQLTGFLKVARKAKAAIVATNLIKLDPLRLPRVPRGDFLEMMRKLQEGDVIVSFLGPPVFSEEEKARLGEKRPKIVAICSGPMPRQINLKELFTQNLLQAAIISRASPDPGPPKGENAQSRFNQYFQLVTPANLNDLPLPPETPAR